jgi:hypothetical protein
MRKAAGKDVGDTIDIQIDFNSNPRIILMHPKLKKHLKKIQLQKKHLKNSVLHTKKEILRYINFLKSEESVDITHLTINKPFIGREK